MPWHSAHADCIGTYAVKQKVSCKVGKKKSAKIAEKKLRALTMIDPVTNWFEARIAPLDDAGSKRISTLFCNFWLCRYPRPVCIACQNSSEFKKHFHTLHKEHESNEKPITDKNLQSNSMMEHAHQVIGNMLRSF